MSNRDKQEETIAPAEYQAALLDYLEVCTSAEELRTQLASEFNGELKKYVESWKLPQIELARFLFEKWSLLK